jgi:hypothetical protein
MEYKLCISETKVIENGSNVYSVYQHSFDHTDDYTSKFVSLHCLKGHFCVWFDTDTCTRVRWFRKKNFRFKAKRDPFRILFVRSREIFFSLLFASNFSLLIKAKLIERILNYFRFVSL